MDPDAILAAMEQQRENDGELPPEQERVPYLGFFLGPEVYGLALDQLREVARVTQVRRVPGAPAGVAGLVNLRGEILCALDVRAILGLPPRISTDPPFLVALRGFSDPLGLIVDSIADIYSLTANEIEAPPSTWPAERAACFIGTARVAAGLMGLIDLTRITKL
jgi:purine-binding chemotaxis protein CheW